MLLSELIEPGDKIDIQMLQQAQQANETGDTTKIYKSSVLDILDDSEMEISMPTEGSKMLLLPAGIRYNLLFYGKNGMYGCVGTVIDRYKKGNLYILLIEMDSELKRIQRREFFRMSCAIDITYYQITDEMAQLETTEEIFQELHDDNFFDACKRGTVLDISGGGIRFVCDRELESQSHLLVIMHLNNEWIDQQFYIVIRIIDGWKSGKNSEKYIYRAKFLIKNPKTREAIIKYIFDEERKARKKENG